MAKTEVKIEQRTDRFIAAYNALKADVLPSNYNLALTIGLNSANSITEITKRRQNIGIENIQKFCDFFDLNFDYFTGKSDVLKLADLKKKEVIALGKKIPMRLKENEFADAFPDWKGIPVFNMPISASFVQHYQDENTYEPMYHLRDPRFKDCNFAAIITGDSMHSEIRHGDYVVCQEIKDMSFILYGDIYYISSKNGIETCKYVNADPNDKDSIMLVPKNEKISPTSMKRKMINKLYKVKGIIRGY